MSAKKLFFNMIRNKSVSGIRPTTLGRVLILLILVLSSVGGSILSVQAATTITFTAEELLGKPTDAAVTINIVPVSTIEYHYQYRPASAPSYTLQTPNVTATGGQPHEITMSGLTANTQYFYRLRYHAPGEAMDDWVVRTEHSFWTQRAAGSPFVFTVTSDAHGNAGSTTMNNILGELPDFAVDLGDTFMVDNASSETQSAVNTRYLNFREPTYFDRIGHSVPIFLSSGNHEEEEGWNLDDTPSRALLSIQARKAFYPTPINDGFYSANTDPLAAIDEATYGDEYREDYYAWEWGDALFVVIDPFQYTMTMPYTAIANEESDETVVADQWLWTLGAEQYAWLKQTLENSTARYKFMFSHQMVGGIPDNSVSGGAGYVRGGAEAAGYFEWGGKNFDGTEGFADNRTAEDFPVPIHQLMLDNHVSGYFHGHDHGYVYEKRDGIVYQEVPSPSMGGGVFGGIYTVGTYTDYETIAICPNSGHLKITIASDLATVEYVRSTTGSCTPSNFSLSYTIDPYISGPTQVLTTAVDPAGGGTISPSAGTHTYPQGQSVSVTATANPGHTFDHWSGDCTGSGACLVTMDEDRSVTAHFATVTHDLTIAVNPSGAGTTNPAVGVHTYAYGTVVPVTATPLTGYAFSSWSGCNSSSGTSCSVTMNADKTVTANFVEVGAITSAATPSAGTVAAGGQVVVSVNIDMTGAVAPNDKLGSFTGSLAWDPAVLQYASHSDLLGGFTGAVNTGQTGSGSLSFNGANATGATGNTVVFQVTFNAIAAGTSGLDLGYTVMAAATTFANLLPQLMITDGQVVVSAGGVLGDVNGDVLANSTDALIVLSADADMDTAAFCPMNCGDANADGLVNSTDALIILSYDALMSVPFPVGTGACPASLTEQPPGCSVAGSLLTWWARSDRAQELK